MTDKQIVRELAKRYMEVATSPKQLAAHRRMQDTNDLKIVRPPVLMDEIPWHQINIDNELTCICQDPRARRAEWLLRANLSTAMPFWNPTSGWTKATKKPPSAGK